METTLHSTCNEDASKQSGTVRFPCPKCGKTVIIRSKHARELATKYTCPQCGFRGPN